MAFTAENKADAYLFFVLAFNAAPGSVYGAQIVEAYNAGLTTQQIVNNYTTKEQFLAQYPAADTNSVFASKLVANVVGSTATDAAKAQAVTDIEAALAAGLSRGDVIANVLGNLAKMDTANAVWGKTVAMISNKIAVAKALTEGDKALNTTDVASLQNPLKGVTDDVGSVQTAINGAGDLIAKLDALVAARKAVADNTEALKDAGINDLNANLDNKEAAVKTAFTFAKVGDVVTAIPAAAAVIYDVADTAAIKAAKLSDYKANNEAATATALKALNAKKADADFDAVAKNALAIYQGADAAKTAATKSEAAAKLVFDKAILDYKAAAAGNAGATVTSVKDGAGIYQLTIKGVAVTEVKDGALVLKAGVNETTNKGITALLNAYKPESAAQKTLDDASAQLSKATNYLAGTHDLDGVAKGQQGAGTVLTAAEVTAADNVKTAQKLYDDLVKELGDVNKEQAAVVEAQALIAHAKQLDDAVKAAEKVFTDGGQAIPVEAKGNITATDKTDLFVAVKDNASIFNFGLAGQDALYVGKGYELNTSGDLTKGNAGKFEVFFKANGLNTDVYVEQKSYGSDLPPAADTLAKITLVGVDSTKLVFKDGLITLA